MRLVRPLLLPLLLALAAHRAACETDLPASPSLSVVVMVYRRVETLPALLSSLSRALGGAADLVVA